MNYPQDLSFHVRGAISLRSCCASPLIMALYPALSASESHADPSHVGQELVVLALKYTA